METGNRGALIAALGLIVVLAAGVVGYRVLGAQQAELAANALQSADVAAANVDDAVDVDATADGDATVAADPAPKGPALVDFDATVYTEAGEARSLTDIANGKPLVINFWATWCPYCIQEMPDFLELHEKYGDRVSFAFVDYTDGVRETVEMGSTWLSENGFESLPAFYDTDLAAVSAFGVRSYPTTVVVDASGEIIGMGSGMIDPDLLAGMLETLVA